VVPKKPEGQEEENIKDWIKMIITIISWISAVTVLTGFLLISQGKIGPKSRTYLLLNLLGSIGLALSALATKTYAFVLLNTVWGFVALLTLIKTQKSETNSENATE